jgi:hypothetical protein
LSNEFRLFPIGIVARKDGDIATNGDVKKKAHSFERAL